VIPLDLQETLRSVFAEGMKDPVKVDFITQRPLKLAIPGREDCQSCEETGALVADLAALHPALRLTVHERGAEKAFEERYGIDQVPAIVLRGVLNRPAVFFGEPKGYLFEPFLEALIMTSRNDSALPADVTKKLKRLREPVRVQLLADPSSPPSGQLAQIAFALATESKNVKLAIYALHEFPRLAQRYAVQATPTTILAGRSAFVGVVDASVFVENMLRAIATRTAVALPRGSDATPFDPDAPAQEASQPQTVRPSGLYVPSR
jgi:hypothetical protein